MDTIKINVRSFNGEIKFSYQSNIIPHVGEYVHSRNPTGAYMVSKVIHNMNTETNDGKLTSVDLLVTRACLIKYND